MALWGGWLAGIGVQIAMPHKERGARVARVLLLFQRPNADGCFQRLDQSPDAGGTSAAYCAAAVPLPTSPIPGPHHSY